MSLDDAKVTVTPSWPYDWQALDNTLDIAAIESQGEYLLHRALNIKRLIAFVGSGVSVAYGRVAWSELATLHIDEMITVMKGISKNDNRHSLVKYIEDLRGEQGSLSGPSLYEGLQACEQIWRLTAANHDEGSARSGGHVSLSALAEAFDFAWPDELQRVQAKGVNGPDRGSFLFREWIKRETHDELPHVKRVIWGWQSTIVESDEHAGFAESGRERKRSLASWVTAPVLGVYEGIYGNSLALRKAVDKLTCSRRLTRNTIGGDAREHLAFYHQDFIRALVAAGRSCPQSEVRIINDVIRTLTDVSERCLTSIEASGYLRPVRGFAVGLVLDLFRLIIDLTDYERRGGGQLDLRVVATERAESKVTTESVPSRASLIPAEHDPLHKLGYDLGIKRFMTTNYDLEVERFFHDMGYKTEDGVSSDGLDAEDAISVETTGGRTRDFVLTERSGVDLVDFAANEPPYDFQVVHLHGRATDDNDIVVTETDYQRMYVRESSGRVAFKEGLDITFGGNPILFVGLGMGEGDVLRPLREFKTNPSLRNRSVIALRDGREKEVEQQTFAKDAYARYGVHVVHYGRVGSVRSSPNDRYHWLHQISKKVRKLGNALVESATAIEELVRSEAISIGSSMDGAGQIPRASALKLVELAVTSLKDIEFRIHDGGWSVMNVFESDGGRCDVVFEITVLDSIRHTAISVLHSLGSDGTSLGSDKRVIFAKFLRMALRTAIDRVEASIVTAALNAKLEGLKTEWNRWWRDWRAPLRARTEVARYEQIYVDQPIWARHCSCETDGEMPTLESRQVTRGVAADVEGVSSSPAIPRARREAVEPPGLVHFLRAANELPEVKPGRRIFVLVGARGSGKGTVYNALARCGNRLLGKTDKRYAGQFFATFSFSFEIASVWDALLSFLDDPMLNPNLFDERNVVRIDTSVVEESDWRRREAIGTLSRVDAFRRVMDGLTERSSSSQGNRVLVVFNAFDILIDEDGEAKNSEINSIMEQLFGEGSKNAPLDLICICRDRNLPKVFRKAKVSGLGGISEPPPQFVESNLLKPRPLTLLLSDSQRTVGKYDKTAAKIHRDLLGTLENSQAFVRLREADGDESSQWLRDELGLSSQSDHGDPCDYMHILDLPNPVKFDWHLFTDDTRDRLREAARLSMGKVGRTYTDGDEALNRLFYVHLGRHRFLYTLVVAVAFSERSVAKLTRFLERLIPSVRGPGISLQDRVVEAVLRYWFEQSEDQPGARGNPELNLAVIRHLAVIATPVTVDVLTLCPKITEHMASNETARREAILDNVLGTLCERGLVFRLQAHGGDTSRVPRYVVHRSIQRYIFRKLGSQRLEPSEGQLFTLSLYAAQQREYPRLNAEAYGFIYDLVGALSAYPSRYGAGHSRRDLAERALRAALGVARGLFSVGVVSRFSDVGGSQVTKPDRVGYFEHHRFLVRWLLFYARELEARADDRQAVSEWPPFYRDDIVWLVNECGVFSHAQGQAYDASALFWLAGRLARDIEGLRSGVMRTRIVLNDAWCCIDRARLDDAEAKYNEVIGSHSEEHLLRLVARGGLALVNHIRGRTDMAKSQYEETIRDLEPLNRLKPLSLFQKCLGELKRHMGMYEAAETDLVKAVQIAEAGGYIEFVHEAQVSRVRNAINLRGSEPARLTEILDAAQNYAERMDLGRLLCEVLRARAELLIAQGQSAVAAQFATRAIRIATLNGLTLRKIAHLELLARIEQYRGNYVGAARLDARIVRAARHVGYNLTVERIESARDQGSMLPIERAGRGIMSGFSSHGVQ